MESNKREPLFSRHFRATPSISATPWMINFRVANLDRMITQLRAKGIEVTLDPEIYPNGRFARLNDPEGNPIELWEPKADS